MLPNRNSTIEEWIKYDRTRPLAECWKYKELEFKYIYEIYNSSHWRELEKIFGLEDDFYYPKIEAMTFEELIAYIDKHQMTYAQLFVGLDHEEDIPIVCGTLIPQSINVTNYHIIREKLKPSRNEPLFIQVADRPDLVPCIRHLYPNFDWFDDNELTNNWVITLIRYGIYPEITDMNKDCIIFTKKDIKKIKKGYRLCIGTMKPRNQWEYEKALILSLIGYENAIPLESFDLDKYLYLFMQYSHIDHVKQFLKSKGLRMDEDMDGEDSEEWCTTYFVRPIRIEPLKLTRKLTDISIMTSY